MSPSCGGSSASRGSLTLHSENGDALHPELFRGAEGAIGDEPVLDVLLDLRDGESGRFDCAAVGVALGDAAETSDPEIGVAQESIPHAMAGPDFVAGEPPTLLAQP